MDRTQNKITDEKFLAAFAKLVVTDTLNRLGLAKREISFSEARRLYGNWFTRAVKEGRIEGVKHSAGANSKVLYRVDSIEALMAADYARAELA